MYKKLLERFFGKKNKELLFESLTALKVTRKESNFVVLYGTPTNGSWLGITNATKGLFPDSAIAIPQWYSNPVFTLKEQSEFCREIINLKFSKVIISGFAPYFFEWIEQLRGSVDIDVIFHGTISEFHEKSKQVFIGKIIQFGKQGKIKRFGFVKKGLAEVFNKLYGFECYHQPLSSPEIPKNIQTIDLDRSKIHIGVFGGDTFNKNLHNQVIHALLIENTIVHVLDKSIFSYLQMDDRIIAHGKNLSRDKFLNILGSMDLNLYMSYSESWGLIAYESEAMGVPCVNNVDVDYKFLIASKLSSSIIKKTK
jgi:glycosyltransferase involved in cell wall biosynthesis